MEEEVKEERVPRFNKRVSFFKKRKKPKIRSTVSANSHRNYTRLIINISLIIIGLLIVTVLLFITRRVVLPKLLNRDSVILNPQGAPPPDNNQVKNIIVNTGLVVDEVRFSTNSAVVTFTLNKVTNVILSLEKDIAGQMDIVEAISSQIIEDGKQAIYIDLRYNKPIVKF